MSAGEHSMKVTMEVKASYVLVTLEGVETLDGDLLVARDLSRFCEEKGMTRVLVDMRQLAIGISIMENFELAKEFSATQTNIVRMALVANEILESTEFMATAFVNRGVNTKVFTDLEEAAEWLVDRGVASTVD